jgi:8-oxo-dGTP pyrophosphatase MutT (NUDIX family)
MYEVFVNNVSLVISNNRCDDNRECYRFEKGFDWTALVSKISKVGNVCVISSNIDLAWSTFKKELVFIQAAGGVVYQDNKILFIFRNGKWDLPKGKLEKRETIEECAIREVEEECGVVNIKISIPLKPTYHVYLLNGQLVLKETFWFKMLSDDNYDLKPQVEEGIEYVGWKSMDELDSCMSNTYPNIIKVIESL